MPNDFDDNITVLHKLVIGLRRNSSYLLLQIDNADQTPLYSDIPTPTNMTMEGKGVKCNIPTSGC
jgi:hypothetical protein